MGEVKPRNNSNAKKGVNMEWICFSVLSWLRCKIARYKLWYVPKYISQGIIRRQKSYSDYNNESSV